MPAPATATLQARPPTWPSTVRRRRAAGLAKRNISQVTALVKTRLKRMQYPPGLINGYLAKTGLDLTPS